MKKSKPPVHQKQLFPPRRAAQIAAEIEQIEALAIEGEIEDALDQAKALTLQYPREARVLKMAAGLYEQINAPWYQLTFLRRAADLDPAYLPPLVELFDRLELHIIAIQTTRKILKLLSDPLEVENVNRLLELQKIKLKGLVNFLSPNRGNIEEGLRLMEEAQIALHTSDYNRCIQLNLQSSRILANFPPPLNNLSLAYFFSGQWKHAIQIARSVLAIDPDNIQAHGNLIHFLAWSGSLPEAQLIWQKFKKFVPRDPNSRLKMIETAAIMEDDPSVFDLFLGQKGESVGDAGLDQRARLFQAVAEANLGKPGARSKLSRLAREGDSRAGQILIALKQGRSGLGLSSRFPYTHSSALIGDDLAGRMKEIKLNKDKQRVDKLIKQLLERYPQLILVAQKLIYEDDQAEAGCELLCDIASPQSYSLLREFGQGQLGEYKDRMHALNLLLNAGEFENGASVKIWKENEWVEIELRRILISDEDDRPYSLQIRKILDQGLRLYQNQKFQEAVTTYLRVLELEPRAKEAYNNLGTIYLNQGDEKRALEMLTKALEIDPLYIMVRCNLAQLLISKEKVEQAEEMIQPLAKIERASPQAMALLSYTRARIAVLKDRLDEAMNHAEIAVKMNPDLTAAQDLLDHLKCSDLMSHGFSSWHERDRERREKARAKLQQTLNEPDPPISSVLLLYSKEVLVAIARCWNPPTGWSTLKKAPLLALLEKILLDPWHLSYVINGLSAQEKSALRLVLSKGGTIDWQEFSQTFDNDLAESPYWQYHDPETVMGRLRSRCLLVEVTVAGALLLAIPRELRPLLPSLD